MSEEMETYDNTRPQGQPLPNNQTDNGYNMNQGYGYGYGTPSNASGTYNNGYADGNGYQNPNTSGTYNNGYVNGNGYQNPNASGTYSNGYADGNGYQNPNASGTYSNGYADGNGYQNPNTSGTYSNGYDSMNAYGTPYNNQIPYGTPYNNQIPYGYSNNQPQEKKGLSIASMVLGIVGILACCIPLIGVPVNLTGLILGIIGIKKGGKGMAIAGIILCSIFLVLTIANSALGVYINMNYRDAYDFLDSLGINY